MQNNIDKTKLKFKSDLNIITETDIKYSTAQLESQTRQEIHTAYMKLYRGLVMVNWARNENGLGRAMYNGAEQIKSFVESKKSDTIISTYLQQVQAQHRVVASKQMMKHPKRDMKLQIPDNQRSEYQQMAADMVNQAIAKINAILANARETQQQGNDMSVNLSKNGSMMHSAQAANARQSTKPVNPSKQMMMSDQQRNAERVMQVQKEQTNPYEKQRPQIVESINGSMMHSENSAGNRNSARPVNPSKSYMPINRPQTVKEPKDNTKYASFKASTAKIVDFTKQKQLPELTPEQKKILMMKRMRDMGNAA